MEQIKGKLTAHGLKYTSNRQQVLEVFLNNEFAISQRFILNQLSNFDRVTLYRTLKNFEEKGLIHCIPDSDGEIKYAICVHNCSPEKHLDSHVHFKCEKCGNTSCLTNETIPPIKLPKGYEANKLSLLVEGICDSCS